MVNDPQINREQKDAVTIMFMEDVERQYNQVHAFTLYSPRDVVHEFSLPR